MLDLFCRWSGYCKKHQVQLQEDPNIDLHAVMQAWNTSEAEAALICPVSLPFTPCAALAGLERMSPACFWGGQSDIMHNRMCGCILLMLTVLWHLRINYAVVADVSAWQALGGLQQQLLKDSCRREHLQPCCLRAI